MLTGHSFRGTCTSPERPLPYYNCNTSPSTGTTAHAKHLDTPAGFCSRGPASIRPRRVQTRERQKAVMNVAHEAGTVCSAARTRSAQQDTPGRPQSCAEQPTARQGANTASVALYSSRKTVRQDHSHPSCARSRQCQRHNVPRYTAYNYVTCFFSRARKHETGRGLAPNGAPPLPATSQPNTSPHCHVCKRNEDITEAVRPSYTAGTLYRHRCPCLPTPPPAQVHYAILQKDPNASTQPTTPLHASTPGH